MAPEVRETLITAEQLARMRLDYPCELVDGRIIRLSPAGMEHGLVIGWINHLLAAHVRRRKLGLVTSGETGYRVRRRPDRVRAPDLAFISKDTIARARRAKETFFPGAPDLAVEVLSPDDSWASVEEKVQDYLSAGAKAVWVVSPTTEKVYVFEPSIAGRVLGTRDKIDGGEALPGFRARVAAFFGKGR